MHSLHTQHNNGRRNTLPCALVLVGDGTNLGGAELNQVKLLKQCKEWGMRTFLITRNKGTLFDEYVSCTDAQLVLPFPYPRKPKSWIHLPGFRSLVKRFISKTPTDRVLLVGDLYPLRATLLLKSTIKTPTCSMWQGEYIFNDATCVKKWIRYGAHRADKLIAAEAVAAHANTLNLLKKSVQTLNPQNDVSRFDPKQHDKYAARKSLGWPKENKMAICIGQIGEGKGQAWLVEQFLQRDLLYENWKLVIAGPLPAKDWRQWRRRLARDVGKRVLFLGERMDIPQLLAASDLAIFPGHASESFGLAVAEATLMGLPVLAFRSGAIPYNLGHTYSGLFDADKPNHLIDRWESLSSDGLLKLKSPLLRDSFLQKLSPEKWKNDLSNILTTL